MEHENVRVPGKCKGLCYVSCDNYFVYRHYNERRGKYEYKLPKEMGANEANEEWEYDEIETSEKKESILYDFADAFVRRFRSFAYTDPNGWVTPIPHKIIENGLFYIAVDDFADGELAMAVKLIQKDYPHSSRLRGLQKRYCQLYLDGMKKILEAQINVFIRAKARNSDLHPAIGMGVSA